MSTNSELIRSSFGAISPNAETLVKRFYEILFERYPQVQALFAHTDHQRQRRMILRSLAVIASNIDDQDFLSDYLFRLGRSHVTHGALPEYYDAVGECLLAAMAEVAADQWTHEIEAAWLAAYGQIKSLMIEGASTQLA